MGGLGGFGFLIFFELEELGGWVPRGRDEKKFKMR